MEEDFAELEKLVQYLECRNTRHIVYNFDAHDAWDSRHLPVSLDADGCFDGEESALLSLTSACGEGTIVLIDRPGPTRWLDVKVLSSAYGHITGTCSHMSSNQILPTRVIEICGPREVKLVEGLGRKAPYSCLSYCWGSKAGEVQSLTTARREMYKVEIPWRVLPNAVAGAIQLARELGLTFIWVDAFCIVQDDPDDWLNEAGKMAEIYGHSSLTITTPQSDGASGDFTMRHLDACSVSIEVSGNNPSRRSTLMVRPQHDCTTMFKRGTSPWMKRGWTLQEWLLSPRVLHCGAMVVWDCSEAAQYEDRADDSPKVYGIYDLRPKPQSRFANLMFGRLRRLDIASSEEPLIDHGGHFGHWNQLWSEIVEDFTSRQFTDPKDKLPALAGLALRYMKDEYAEALRPEYLAGIWRYHSGGPEDPFDHYYYRSEFPGGLLWRRQPGSPYMVQPPPPYRAPSWSWAALDGPVLFMRDQARVGFFEEELCLNVHEAACEYRPVGSISSVTSGHIIADAPVRRAWVAGMGDDGQSEEVSLATDDLPGLEDPGTWMAVFDQAPDPQTQMCLLRVFTKWKPRFGQPTVIHWALVLKPQGSDGNVETFVRLEVALHMVSQDPSKGSESRENWTLSHLCQDWERKKVVII